LKWLKHGKGWPIRQAPLKMFKRFLLPMSPIVEIRALGPSQAEAASVALRALKVLPKLNCQKKAAASVFLPHNQKIISSLYRPASLVCTTKPYVYQFG
jgi:hypothetical protein